MFDATQAVTVVAIGAALLIGWVIGRFIGQSSGFERGYFQRCREEQQAKIPDDDYAPGYASAFSIPDSYYREGGTVGTDGKRYKVVEGVGE